MKHTEAIRRIEDHIEVHKIGQYPHLFIGQALCMAIIALKEQAEREKGCYKCSIEPVNPCIECDAHLINNTPCNEFESCGKYFRYNKINEHHEQNFCSNCGRKLKE